MSRTKIAGYLMIGVAVLKIAADALSGKFDVTTELNSLSTALAGGGFVFLRDALDKITQK